MGVFGVSEFRAFSEKVKSHQINRDALLIGMPLPVLGNLRQANNYFNQIDFDVDWLNARTDLIDGELPIALWLMNASYNVPLNPEAQRYFRELAEEALSKVDANPVEGSLPDEAKKAAEDLGEVINEKVVFHNDLLPITFLEGAARTARSVVRVVVTRFENGTPVTNRTNGQPVVYYGTGWLIGQRHLITNHHVLDARSSGEAMASEADFKTQAEKAIVEFEFDDPNLAPVQCAVASLLCADRGLDFAIVELSVEGGELSCDPLPLQYEPIAPITQESYLPVNIIQHPGGKAKQIALRNNAAVAIKGNILSYFTDTQGGSSGSPVCTDRWSVIALHKAYYNTDKFKYQGRSTAYVNIGTPITLIVEWLKERDLWDQVGAIQV